MLSPIANTDIQTFFRRATWAIAGAVLTLMVANPAVALPPPDEIPEEVLRTEIILEARSPVDGMPLSAAEYAELQADLQTAPYPPQINPAFEHNVFLLRVLKFFRTILPFF
ncbi:MAG: hypothetical protein SWY16_20640 [Cyanobacteriota bacterium]|nr:hypothetical protein [Cyanobacteriota bacterium]